MSDLHDLFGPPIHIYTRKQAIDDGFLVDGGPEFQKLAREAGFTYHLAFTCEAWEDAVAWKDTNRAMQDVKGRAWDVFTMATHAVRHARNRPDRRPDDPIQFQVYRIPNTPKATAPRITTLVLHIGGGDNAEPVLTIMLPGQD